MAASDSTEPAGEGVLTFAELDLALTRCMQTHPPCGLEFEMHRDANIIAGLWGLMSYQRTEAVPVAEVKPDVLDAYRRWARPKS
jgi:hypothetical protein